MIRATVHYRHFGSYSKWMNNYLNEHTLPHLADSMHSEASAILVESQALVPVDTGLLKSSGVIEGPLFRNPKQGIRGDVEVSVIYGGISIPYAVDVHEHTNPNQVFNNGKVPNFVGIPFHKRLNTMASRIVARLRK